MKGYIDGYDKTSTADIDYIYHYHDSSCAAVCSITYSRQIVNNLGNNKYTAYVTAYHKDCGKGQETNYWTVEGNDFNGQTTTHTYYSCGYTEGQLLGAEITFK